MANRIATTWASAIQYMRNSRICRLDAIATTSEAGRLVPEPPPSADVCAASSRNTSAITQVPMAK